MKNNNRKKSSKKFFRNVFVGFFISLMFMHLCFANTASENAELSRIVHILDSLNPIINAAEIQADSTTRIKFRYDWLRKDLASIRAGLAQKINLPQIEPRVVKPLKGDFVRMGDKKL